MSLLDQFRAHRDRVMADQERDLPVPRYSSPQVLVRIRPLDDDSYQAALKRAGTTPDARIDHAAQLVAQACVGVYLRDPDTGSIEPASGDGTIPTFLDATVAPLVGAEVGEPVQLVRQLFVTDADVAAAGDAVLDFSGYGRRIALRAVMGESPATP